MSFTAGQTIGDYTIMGVLGKGGFSTIFKAQHKLTERIDALKILKVNGPDAHQQAERFLREIRIQANLKHRNIVPVHHAFWLNDDLVMVMDFVEGTSLAALLDRRKLPVEMAIDYARQALSALSYAHAHGVVHRDISPANIIITPESLARLTDFGLAKSPADANLTQGGAIMGSLHYMAPEQVKGIDATDIRSDIYGMGAVLYETVTGRKPFDEADAFSIMCAQVEATPTPPIEIDPALPTDLNGIILTALSKKPDERFQSADAFLSALDRLPLARNGSSRPSGGANRNARSTSKRSSGSDRSSTSVGLPQPAAPEDPQVGLKSPTPGRNGSRKHANGGNGNGHRKPPSPKRDSAGKSPGPGPRDAYPSGPSFLEVNRPMKRKSLLVSVGARSQNMPFFVASCLLATVSWYTTEQGMSLYLSTWLAFFSSVGVQGTLVFVARRMGIAKRKTGVLAVIYTITALISVSFSYVSLYSWFSARERPLQVRRQLFDNVSAAADRTGQILSSAISEGQKHVIALQEMATAEKTHGHMTQGHDADPYIDGIRQAVALEVGGSRSYRGGLGEGVSYLAFARYAKLAQQSVERMQESEDRFSASRARTNPSDTSEKQLREFRQICDTVPWNDVEQALHDGPLQKPRVPNYVDFEDHATTGQEDLLMAVKDLVTNPSGRHLSAFALATFIDIIVSLLAYVAGPVSFGSLEKRWFAAGAALDALDSQIFVRDFLRKLAPGPRGVARVDASAISAGEQQVCLLLASKELAKSVEEDGKLYYLLSPEVHEQLLETSGGDY